MASSRWSRSPSDSFRTPNRTRSRLSGVPPPGQLRPSAQFSARSEEAASRSAGSNSASKRRRVSRLRGTIPRQKTTLSGTGRVCALRPLVPGPRCHHSVPLPPPRPPPSPVIPRLATPAPGRTARQRISRADRHRAAPSHGAGARGGVAGPRGRSANTEEPPVARGLHFDSRRGDDPWLERDPLRIAQAERDSDLPVGDPAVAADEVLDGRDGLRRDGLEELPAGDHAEHLAEPLVGQVAGDHHSAVALEEEGRKAADAVASGLGEVRLEGGSGGAVAQRADAPTDVEADLGGELRLDFDAV